MQDILVRLVDVPIARMFVLAAIIFLLVAVLGRIEGKIEPGKIGRIGATVVGMLLMGSGLAMHFIDVEALRDKLQSGVESPDGQTRGAQAAEKLAGISGWAVPVPGAAANDKPEPPAIKIVSGTYGRNCGAKNDNATAHLARRCDGQVACEYSIDPGLEEGMVECAKDFVAEWRCRNDGITHALSVAAGRASVGGIRLACGEY